MSTKEAGRKYVQKRKDKGYVRVNKWCNTEYKKMVYAFIDILACHAEDPSSTTEFHAFIEEAKRMSDKYYSEYEVKND